ncbi:hypothetical protein GCK72_021984 [Caenorhabditis remanei]|uniref:Nematode cuticle collagen N-terminal domain-containing protein n=1 Tax=Caenorhabditis remanei TaxID=31234 RepID=A0A6A5GLK9_CAERE|nr:hypothetical protein GCK72_021984 [Caenorhabditis remanei]KAF1755415.1 hypothetical protein GCK72_021984 [Caenorhabditis remanei]
MVSSEIVVVGTSLLVFLSAGLFVLKTKNELDQVWSEFDDQVQEVTVLRDATWQDLKSLASSKNIPLDRTKRQSYYEKVADSYALPPSLGVEAHAPSISPECNCNLENNNCPAGPPGPKGAPGGDGAPGDTGPPGKMGQNTGDVQTMYQDPGCQYCPAGEMGPPGSPGKLGPRGQRGQNGAAGTPGNNGAPGHNGELGPCGPPGPPGPAGALGRRGMDTVREKGVRGPKGAPGPVGAVGMEGERGNRGGLGVDGPVGPVGIQREPGRAGPVGDAGEVGVVGPNGQDALYCPCPKRVADGAGGGVYQPYKQ